MISDIHLFPSFVSLFPFSYVLSSLSRLVRMEDRAKSDCIGGVFRPLSHSLIQYLMKFFRWSETSGEESSTG